LRHPAARRFRGLRLAAGLALGLPAFAGRAAERTIGVFVALADNARQGIVPVPAALGNGDDPEHNLYWGAGEGFRGVFGKSRNWRLAEKNDAPGDTNVLRLCTFRHVAGSARLTARAYRGAAIRNCLQDFETAVRTGTYDLVVYIGHNGLMDFEPPTPARSDRPAKKTDCMVLCCRSEHYFRRRLERAGGRPVLLTTQLMYPGAFILEAAAEAWLTGAPPAQLRARAAAAYAANQKLSPRAALGVFAECN